MSLTLVGFASLVAAAAESEQSSPLGDGSNKGLNPEDMEKIFNELDKDGDGKISWKEIIKGQKKWFEDGTKEQVEEAKQYFDRADENKDEFIDWLEFEVAMIKAEEIAKKGYSVR